MAEAVDTGMPVGDMRKLLTKSKQEPVSVAVGLDGKNAVMMLHKIKPGKAILKDLQSKFDGLKAPSFGKASVDMDDDPKLVVLHLERKAPGVAMKLRKTLKGTGFSKVRIAYEDGTSESADEEEEQGEEAEATAAPAAPSAEPEAAAASPAAPAAEEPEAQAAAPGADFGPVTQRLTDLAKKVIASDPAKMADVKGFVEAGKAAIAGKDLDNATKAADDLQNLLDAGAAGGAPAGAGQDAADAAPANKVAFTKSRQAWVAARKMVENDLAKLHKEMTEHYKDHGFGAELDKVFNAKVEPMLNSLDASLAAKLDEVEKNTDGPTHTKLVSEARALIDKYDGYLAGEKLIEQLDKNPWVPLSIQKTMTATLTALKKAVV